MWAGRKLFCCHKTRIKMKEKCGFNTLAFGEIKPYGGSLQHGRLDLVYYRDPGVNVGDQFPPLDSPLTAFFRGRSVLEKVSATKEQEAQ
jgi:hypothetical protein